MTARPIFTDGADRHPIIAAAHEALVAHIPPDAVRVLEAGCGEGRVLERLGAGRRRVGLDLAPEPERWRGVADAPAFVRGDVGRMPFADGAFDAASCLFVYPPSGSRWAILRELARVVRPGGTLVFCMQSVFNPMLLVRKLLLGGCGRPLVSPRTVERWLASVGFVVRRRLGVSVPPYVRTRGVAGRAARLYHRCVSSRSWGAPILGIVAERRDGGSTWESNPPTPLWRVPRV